MYVQILTTLALAISGIQLQPLKFKMGHVTWPRPLQGRFVIHMLGLLWATWTNVQI